MKNSKTLLLGALCGWLGMAVVLPSAAWGQKYVWPLEESRNLTSGFCDYRTAHYHGGVDISTGGAEGLKVRAADSGHVYRISTSYWGMGKALYLMLADGRIAVYGHLSQFADPIRRYVEAQQYALRRYNTNLFPLPDELPVIRGEVLAYTGQTGYGSPHLHFELRTGNNFPQNPLAFDYGLTDRTPPEIHGVLIRPLLTRDPLATVERIPEPQYFKAETGGRTGQFHVQRKPVISGTIGLAVECGDPTGYKTNRIAPQRLTMTVNGARWFEVTHDSLDYDLNRQIDVAYDFAWQAEHGEELVCLYRHPANRLPWYDGALGDGVLDPARPGSPVVSGENKITISAFDAAGNEATAHLTVIFNQPPGVRDVRLAERGGQWHLTGTVGDPDDFVSRLVLYRRPQGSLPASIVWSRKDSITSEKIDYLIPGSFAPDDYVALTAFDSRDAETRFAIQTPKARDFELQAPEALTQFVNADFVPGGLVLHAVLPGESTSASRITLPVACGDSLPAGWQHFLGADHLLQSASPQRGIQLDPRTALRWDGQLTATVPDSHAVVTSADSLARARFKPGDLYDGGFFRVRAFTIPRDLKPKPASKIYSFEPISAPFAQKVKVSISYAGLAAKTDDLALYALSEDRKSWAFLARDVDAEAKAMTAAVGSFGAYALVTDTTPPSISAVVPGRDARTTDRRPEITFVLHDEGSGIGADTDIEILLDGEWLIPEYDPETRKGKTRPPEDLSISKHKLEITATDRIGHRDYFVRYFTVVKQPG